MYVSLSYIYSSMLVSPLPLLTQLEMITDLLGTPSMEDVAHVTSKHAVKSLLAHPKPRALGKLYALSPTISHGAVHLLSQMLVFNPVSLLPTSPSPPSLPPSLPPPLSHTHSHTHTPSIDLLHNVIYLYIHVHTQIDIHLLRRPSYFILTNCLSPATTSIFYPYKLSLSRDHKYILSLQIVSLPRPQVYFIPTNSHSLPLTFNHKYIKYLGVFQCSILPQ